MGAVTQQTRRASYGQVLEELGERQAQVFAVVAALPGITAWEIAAQIKRYVHAVRPRLTELRDKGLIEEQGTKWRPETSRTEARWVLSDPPNGGQQELAL